MKPGVGLWVKLRMRRDEAPSEVMEEMGRFRVYGPGTVFMGYPWTPRSITRACHAQQLYVLWAATPEMGFRGACPKGGWPAAVLLSP
jgi:hypothetical protein